MKKIILLPITLLIVIFLSACNNSVDANTIDKGTIVINVKNNTNFEIYGLELNWYQNEKLKGTQGTMNADGSKIGRGESFVFELNETDLNIEDKALFEVALIDDKNNEKKIVINKKVSLELSKNSDCFLGISGDTLDNLKLDSKND